jgi:ArsR family metal-binding transcriptional regulator
MDDEGEGMEKERLIEGYDIEIETPACEPGAERHSVFAHLAMDISPVFPYLNAILKGAIYHQEAGALTWKKGGHGMAFHPRKVAINNFEEREAAEREMVKLIDLVNDTWARRAEIVPDTRTRQRPTAMAVFKLLPQGNCKTCGESSCFTFASKLAAGQQSLEKCGPLAEASNRDRRETLLAMIDS